MLLAVVQRQMVARHGTNHDSDIFLKQNVEMYNLYKKESCKKERNDGQGSDATSVAYADPSDGARPFDSARQPPLRTSRVVVRWPLSCDL